MYDGAFGRGQLYVRIKGQETDAARAKPLTVDDENEGKTFGEGDLLGFTPIEPIWSTPYQYNSNDPTREDFYKPEAWYIMGVQTHSTRLLTFIGRPVPDILKPSYNFSGMSLSQLIEPYVVRWLKTVDSVNRLISRFSLTVLATDMQSTLQGGDGTGLLKRVAVMNRIADNRGCIAVNKATEEVLQVNTPLSGLSELQAQSQEHMAAPTGIPLVKMTGATPDGLNASSEGEIKVFYDRVAAEQINVADPHVRQISRMVQLHLWGKVDENIKYVWVPLDTPTDKEESEMRKADGDRDTSYVGAGIVSPEEVRQRLRTDPNSGYTFIVPEEVPATSLEQEAELGEEGKDADHQRGLETGELEHDRSQETAQADHKRAKELERIKAAGKRKPAK